MCFSHKCGDLISTSGHPVCLQKEAHQGSPCKRPCSGEGERCEVWFPWPLAEPLLSLATRSSELHEQPLILALFPTRCKTGPTEPGWGPGCLTHSLQSPFPCTSMSRMSNFYEHCIQTCLECTWRHSHSLGWLSTLFKKHTHSQNPYFSQVQYSN